MEIGSEFWIEDCMENLSFNNQELITRKFGNTFYTSSGRSALVKVIENSATKSKKVLLPSYICDSVIAPFVKYGFECDFYNIDDSFRPILLNYEHEYYDFFLHLGYFGFHTNQELGPIIKKLKQKGTIVIEDVTHTLFTDGQYHNLKSDYYIASIRKWMGLPSGGFVASKKFNFANNSYDQTKVVELRISAFDKKKKYIFEEVEELKDIFLQEFYEAEKILDQDIGSYRIDQKSIGIFTHYNIDTLINTRKKNYRTLLEGVQSISNIEPVYKELPKEVCPLFFPIYIYAQRDQVREKLIEHKIYCPIHWPISSQSRRLSNSRKVTSILSIPCDQRYNENDMKRIISLLKSSFS